MKPVGVNEGTVLPDSLYSPNWIEEFLTALLPLRITSGFQQYAPYPLNWIENFLTALFPLLIASGLQ